jgi:hypothetical protein
MSNIVYVVRVIKSIEVSYQSEGSEIYYYRCAGMIIIKKACA